jgi:hypothetical protein
MPVWKDDDLGPELLHEMRTSESWKGCEPWIRYVRYIQYPKGNRVFGFTVVLEYADGRAISQTALKILNKVKEITIRQPVNLHA